MSHVSISRDHSPEGHASLLPPVRDVRLAMFRRQHQVWLPGRHGKTVGYTSQDHLGRKPYTRTLLTMAATSTAETRDIPDTGRVLDFASGRMDYDWNHGYFPPGSFTEKARGDVVGGTGSRDDRRATCPPEPESVDQHANQCGLFTTSFSTPIFMPYPKGQILSYSELLSWILIHS